MVTLTGQVGCFWSGENCDKFMMMTMMMMLMILMMMMTKTRVSIILIRGSSLHFLRSHKPAAISSLPPCGRHHHHLVIIITTVIVSAMIVREASAQQNGWFFGKLPTNYVADFCCDFVTNFQKKTMNFWKGGRGSFTIQNLFAEFLDFPKECNRVFRNKAGEGGYGSQRLFGVFPKIHPFWLAEASLRIEKQKYSTVLVNIKI